MKIENLVGNFENIFNPTVSFESYFEISSSIITKASKYYKGTNLVEEYLYKKYYYQIYENFEAFLNSAKIPLPLCSELSDSNGRKLKPLVSLFLRNYISALFRYKFSTNPTDLELINEENKRFLKDRKANIIAILKNDMNIKDDIILLNICKMMKEPMRKVLQKHDLSKGNLKEQIALGILLNNDKKMMLYNLVQLKDICTKLILHYDSIINQMSVPLELKDLNDLIDYNILYLALAKVFMEEVKFNISTGQELPVVVLFLYRYYNALKILKDYNYTIDTSDILFSKGKQQYGTKDFIKEFEKIVIPIKDPEIRYYQIMENDNSVNYRDINNVKKKIEYLKALDDSRAIVAEWDFIPKGESIISKFQPIVPKQHKKSKELIEERGKRLEKVEKRIQFLDNTPYIYKGVGKNEFDGYIAYMYSNGYVIFEKFYENQRTLNPSRNNATYIMNSDNFVEMSKLSKPEIMEYIKSGNTDVMRKIHSTSWKSNMLNIINSSFYSKEKIEKIDMLISLGKIKSKELGKKYE